ncbi:hypothetical protein KJ359_004239 [Pestalotiopsis sp. 9143b]|nr:hypothetical protein KJ359_004239 [Pestalotiopsis sp. 9143b]
MADATDQQPNPRSRAQAAQARSELQLKHELNGVQILFIVLSAAIGSGVFNSNGEALRIAGPLGMILAVLILGLIAAMVAETIGEFVRLFPAPNAVYEYVYAFLDEELAVVTALAYWYCYAAVFANQMLSAAKLLHVWQVPNNAGLDLSPSGGLPAYLFYGIIPAVLFAINLSGVKVFGWIETVGGFVKFIMLTVITWTLFGFAGIHTQGAPLTQGRAFVTTYAASFSEALCVAFPTVAFGYIGIESIIMAAFEAYPMNPRSADQPRPIRRKGDWDDIFWASHWAHWLIVGLYLLYTLAVVLTVPWDNEHLPVVYGQSAAGSTYSSTTIIAMKAYAHNQAALNFVNVCLIFCVLSAANTSLYIASRTLWGLARYASGNSSLRNWFATLSNMWDATSVPIVALLVSLVAFTSWLPASQFFAAGVAAIPYFLSTTASTCCLIVWAVVCLAHCNFYYWTTKSGSALLAMDPFNPQSGIPLEAIQQTSAQSSVGTRPLENVLYSRYIPGEAEFLVYASSINSFINRFLPWNIPWTGIIGATGSIVVFAFNVAIGWKAHDNEQVKVWAAYSPHIVCLGLWSALKVHKYYGIKYKPRDFEDRYLWLYSTDKDQAQNLKDRLVELHNSCIKSDQRNN